MTYEKLQAENKILRKEKCLDEILESYAEYNDKLEAENKARKDSMDELLKELKEVAETAILPDGDGINIPTMMWLERIIKKTEDPKP